MKEKMLEEELSDYGDEDDDPSFEDKADDFDNFDDEADGIAEDTVLKADEEEPASEEEEAIERDPFGAPVDDATDMDIFDIQDKAITDVVRKLPPKKTVSTPAVKGKKEMPGSHEFDLDDEDVDFSDKEGRDLDVDLKPVKEFTDVSRQE